VGGGGGGGRGLGRGEVGWCEEKVCEKNKIKKACVKVLGSMRRYFHWMSLAVMIVAYFSIVKVRNSPFCGRTIIHVHFTRPALSRSPQPSLSRSSSKKLWSKRGSKEDEMCMCVFVCFYKKTKKSKNERRFLCHAVEIHTSRIIHQLALHWLYNCLTLWVLWQRWKTMFEEIWCVCRFVVCRAHVPARTVVPLPSYQ
jgi:hypothetical protein